jgi:hypothetical protein
MISTQERLLRGIARLQLRLAPAEPLVDRVDRRHERPRLQRTIVNHIINVMGY